MYNHTHYSGIIEVICGSMFSGKTEELIRRIKRFEYANKKMKVFNHASDDRYATRAVVSHNGTKTEAISLLKSREIFNHISEDDEVIFIDEVQFFDDEVVNITNFLAKKGFRVIVAGLDKDFRGEPFPIMAKLLTSAEDVTKLTAVCVKCGAPATVTQRIIDNKPASYNDPVILVGTSESYEPRCRHCHIVYDLPHDADYEKIFSNDVKGQSSII